MVRPTVYLLMILVGACGEVPVAEPDGGGGGGDGGGVDAPGPEWVIEATDPDSIEPFFHAVGEGSSIYYSHDTQDATTFFRHYELGTGQVLDDMTMPLAENDLCGCGLGSDLVAGGGQIHYFANFGHGFDVATAMWQSLPNPNPRGEAAVARLGSTIVFVGGRGPLSTCTSYDVVNDQWNPMSVPDYPAAVENARGAAVGGRMYVLGGRNGVTDVPLVASWLPGEPGWTVHGDLPEQRVDQAVGFRGEIWALFGTHFRRFDPSTNSWGAGVLDLPPTAGRGIPVVVTDPSSGEEALYFVDAADAGTRFIRYAR